MKRLVSLFFFSFLAFSASGQYGNEWITYGQRYLKIPVAREGMYRLSYSSLQQAGFRLSADPRTFQLFHRGVEQAIAVYGEDDGVFNETDFVEFYGRGNDGTLDSSLYQTPADQPHRLYNLFSDTTSYFLTAGLQTGQRITSAFTSSAGLTPQTWHSAEALLILTESYASGIDYSGVQKTAFNAGEGWTGRQLLQNQEITYALGNIVQTETDAGKPRIEVLLTGRGPMHHDVELYAGSRLITTVGFEGFESLRHEQEIEWSDIDASGVLSVKVRVTGMGGSDRLSIGYVRLRFPQSITLAGVSARTFHLAAASNGLAFIRIENPPAGIRLFDVTDPARVRHIRGEQNGTLDAVVPAATISRKVIAVTDVLLPSRMRPVSFRQINPALHNYVIITHPLLRKPAGGYVDPVKAYAEYRMLPEGGGFDTLIVDINHLYDQFNYGEPSPRAIFQFMKFLARVKLPDYLFLIGKGLDVNYGYHRNPSAFTLFRDLVPTAGYPASDMAFTAGLSGIPEVPAVATGRLTATSAAEVAAYLNKVKTHGASPFNNLARKRILHLSGGIEEQEPAFFRGIMQGFEAVAEDIYLGGQVQAIAKASTGIKVINIAEKVNAGVGLITFFGHSAPNTLDFDIGFVSDPVMGYDNAGKYPFLLMNGCNVGSFFLNADIFGENWIKTPGKGAIGFIAHSAYGLTSALQRYSATFYEVAFGDSVFIRKGVGKVQQEVARRYLENYGMLPREITQVQQMVLLGDPAVKVFGAAKPDHAIDEQTIFISAFNDEPITAMSDSFTLHVPVRNFGIARDEDTRITVTRQYDNGTVLQYDSIFPPVLFEDTLSLVIRNADQLGYGMNSFTIMVDADNLTDELNETNNTASFTYFIPLNSTRNLYPYNFSIVQTERVDLSFQHTDLLSGPREYILEIDTTRTFDSGFKQDFILQAEVLVKQRVQLLNRDSVVYFWRTRIAQPLDSESKDWTVSSFSYLSQGPEGWAQLRFAQYESNAGVGLTQDPQLKRIEFKETVSDIAIKTFSSASAKPTDSVTFKINGVEFNLSHEGTGCRNNTLNLVAFDKRSTQPYAGIYFKWYELLYKYGGRQLICGREPFIINSFKPQELITGNQDDLVQYVDNVRTGDSVVLFNIGDAGYDAWPAAAKTKLEELGISVGQWADIRNGDPAIIFGRKGAAPGTAQVFHAMAPETSVGVRKTIAGRLTSGSMSSTRIGPATTWGKLVPQVNELEASDVAAFTLVGLTADHAADTLKTGIVSTEDLAFIDAAQYPWLQVIFNAADEVNMTAAQLKKWIVSYEPVADGVVVFRRGAPKREVFEGEMVSADFGFVNISDKTFSDSLTVRYNLLNGVRNGPAAATVKIHPPLPGDTTLFSLNFSTVSKTGMNDVEVFVNPRIQMEESYDNNRIVLPDHVNVLMDKSHPVLEVTFDGRRLENNDYVTANPAIVISVWDENPFVRKRDTLGVRIFLSRPCNEAVCGFERVYFSRPDVTWLPASAGSAFTVRFTPLALTSGEYVLRVSATDARGNSSGDVPYEIAFRVETANSVSGLPPFPNPFYGETIFDVTVTGAKAGGYFYDLQITDISGKRVDVVSQHTTALHVGRNTIVWDGQGTDGNSLPNGIYFYRLKVSNGDSGSEYSGRVVLLR